MNKPTLTTSGLTAKFMDCGVHIRVAYRPCTITLTANGVTRSWEIPIGFGSNLVSSPKWARCWIPRWDKAYLAALLHDYLYAYHLTTRAEADKIFLLALEALGVSKLKRTAMYAAVRLRGQKSWEDMYDDRCSHDV